nr:MAG TPA: hypothetical protein [Caudoviricetes sp.]
MSIPAIASPPLLFNFVRSRISHRSFSFTKNQPPERNMRAGKEKYRLLEMSQGKN